MTGMGRDGLEGARQIKAEGGCVMAQSEETCVIYGMPKAVVTAGLTDAVVPLDELASTLAKAMEGRAVPLLR
jgi:two-component system chemotaxis response regulator CheB